MHGRVDDVHLRYGAQFARCAADQSRSDELRTGCEYHDHVPMVNIMPFGMCMSPSNPTVASATAAAMGVLTPMPCIPNTPAPWTPGAATVLEANFPVLDNVSTLNCIWGGVITFVTPGEFNEMVP